MDFAQLRERFTKLHEPTDCDGKPIAELEGLKLKPLSVSDLLRVHDYNAEHGEKNQYKIIFALGVVRPDGSRIIGDNELESITDFTDGPVGAVILKIREISGHAREDEPKKAPSQEKTS